MDIAGGEQFDVIVVGAGNAATCAALSAREGGARVLMLEVAPEHWRGGNSAFTGGAWRIVYHGFDDLARLIPDISDHELANVDVGTYTEEQYYDDVGRLTEYRSDPDLTEILITRSFDAGLWMREQGVRFQLGLGRQAFQVDGKFKFWGGLACHIWGGGKELMKALHGRAEREQIAILYDTPAVALLQGDDGIAGVRVRRQGRLVDLRAKAVVLACGGFEANAEMRARYLGPGWDLAKVRGSRFNTGQGLKMALDIGAAPAGHWSGAHACAWDLNAPPVGDLDVGDRFQKHGYPFGIVVNAKGQRFLDEGLDFHSYTYAKYGGEILKQPGMFAWQVFDQKAVHLLRDEYRIPRTTKEKADTLRGFGREARRGRCARVSGDGAGVQRGAAPRGAVQPQHPRRARDQGPGDRQDQLGAAPRSAALRGLCGDDRHHLHLRRAQDHQRHRRSRTRPASRSRASLPPARSSAGSTTTITPAAPG